MDRTRRRIEYLNAQGTVGSVEVEWWSEPREDGWPVYHVRIPLPEASSEGTGNDVYEAFQNARVDLEKLGFRFLCYGASLQVWPSGMARDQGQGRKAYVLRLDRPMSFDDLVDIFDTGEEVRPCTVAEQCAFAEEWRAEKKKIRDRE